MAKNLIMEEGKEFHRVWNFVVPAHMSNNSPIQSIPPLTKKSKQKTKKSKKSAS
jgi:hypothetical protein